MRFGRRWAAGLVGGGLAGLVQPAAAKVAPRHRLALHVNGGPDSMTEGLHNLVNAAEYYRQRGEALAIELVANGVGYPMLRDTSPVRSFVLDVQKSWPTVVFSACQNSRRAFAHAEGKTVEQVVELPGVNDVPAGIARLLELQEQGWAYYRV